MIVFIWNSESSVHFDNNSLFPYLQYRSLNSFSFIPDSESIRSRVMSNSRSSHSWQYSAVRLAYPSETIRELFFSIRSTAKLYLSVRFPFLRLNERSKRKTATVQAYIRTPSKPTSFQLISELNDTCVMYTMKMTTSSTATTVSVMPSIKSENARFFLKGIFSLSISIIPYPPS